MTSNATIQTAAEHNGWTHTYVAGTSTHHVTRGDVYVTVTTTARGSVSYASTVTRENRMADTYVVLGSRDRGKLATVLSWLEAPADTVYAEQERARLENRHNTSSRRPSDAPVDAWTDSYERKAQAANAAEGASALDALRSILGDDITDLLASVTPEAVRVDDVDPMTDADEQAHVDAVSAEFESARTALSSHIRSAAMRVRVETGIGWYASSEAPETYAALREVHADILDRREDGALVTDLPVFDGASDHTVYTDAATNHAFRYWHDMGHLRNYLTFTPEDELTLQTERHIPELERYGLERHSLAWWLYYADTVGQIQYNTARGEFPTDQLAFAIDYVTDAMDGIEPTYALHAGDYTIGGK